jgi:solute carrier family 25 S-adenosylmethionine transporter 26
VGFLGKFAAVVVGAKAHLAAAGCARATSIFAMYPVDTVKTRMQMGKAAFSGAAIHTYYKGVAGSLAGQIPYSMVTFASYEVYKEELAKRFPGLSLGWRTFAAAVMGDLTGSVWLCPSEVLKQQMQAGMHANMAAAVRSIWQTAGAKGFYTGYVSQISRDVPFRACQLVSYELVKANYLKLTANNKTSGGGAGAGGGALLPRRLAAWEGMVVGAIAGSLSAAATNPLDVLKTRMMTGQAHGATSVARAVQLILANEGPRALFAGVVPRVVYVGPSSAIFFLVYEYVHAKTAAATTPAKQA